MARVTFGVPVYNGAISIEACLQNLADQDFQDFEVLISDNASTDGTSDICAEFAAKDARFRHHRHEQNQGILPNFFWVRDHARSPLFAWRAHDDWSSTNYIGRLVACFDRDDTIKLAAGTIETRSYRANGEPRIKRFPFPEQQGPGFAGRFKQLYLARASWFYGLWDREALIAISNRLWSVYPYTWGYDHLCVAAVILDGKLSGDAKAEFTQHMDQRGRDHGVSASSPHQMLDLRQRFGDVLSAEIARGDWNPLQYLAYKCLVPVYMDHRLDHRRRIYKLLLREKLGIK